MRLVLLDLFLMGHSEAMFFIDHQGKLCAASGHMDDRVMATAVALKIIAVTPSIRRQEAITDLPSALVTSYISTARPSRMETVGRYM